MSPGGRSALAWARDPSLQASISTSTFSLTGRCQACATPSSFSYWLSERHGNVLVGEVSMCRRLLLIIGATLVALVLLLTTKMGRSAQDYSSAVSPADRAMEANDDRMIAEGRRTFRFDTFGDEAFWGDTLHLHQAIAGGKLGGVGSGVTPRNAQSVGLQSEGAEELARLTSAFKAG